MDTSIKEETEDKKKQTNKRKNQISTTLISQKVSFICCDNKNFKIYSFLYLKLALVREFWRNLVGPSSVLTSRVNTVESIAAIGLSNQLR